MTASNQTQQTPGPWVAEKRDGDEWWFGGRNGMEIVVRPANEPFGTVCVLGANTEEGPADSNARLIAAAPDLLEAMRDMLAGWIYIRQFHGDLYGVGWDRAQGKAEAALAKAGVTP